MRGGGLAKCKLSLGTKRFRGAQDLGGNALSSNLTVLNARPLFPD